ncbi:hypothetical protein [Undibacterium griseum]|uniref:Uncharacterized protein n=1 Tax=Undibacterium griseum TaxID=2762295 RepID=A0ABR6YIM0_9BURK|nr:hypothetical protein [Undibacterium griseum]MBC3883630.1 hypothetical protein [Undibacterium griseum]
MTADNISGSLLKEHHWVALESSNDAEAWLDLHDRELQQLLGQQKSHALQGQGVCFTLVHGGEIYLHTNSDGDILLDVTPEAEWAQPVLSAVTGTAPPRGQIWLLQGHLLVQLLIGLNSLIASSRLVLQHAYRMRG